MLTKDLRKNLVIPSSEGIDLFGLLHVPHTRNIRPPLVIFFHGFNSHKYGSRQYFVKLSKLLALSGIASLRVDFRGSGDSEGILHESSFSDLREDALNIIKTSFDFSEINPEKIGLFGSSLGGSLAILSLEKYSSSIQALGLWAPVISGDLWKENFISSLKEHNSENNVPNPLSITSQRFQEQFLKLDTTSILKNLPAHLAVLHMHGVLDTEVLIHHQELFSRCINQQIRSLTIKSYETTAHNLGNFSENSSILHQISQWFVDQLR